MLSSYDGLTTALLKVGIELWVGSLIVGLVGRGAELLDYAASARALPSPSKGRETPYVEPR